MTESARDTGPSPPAGRTCHRISTEVVVWGVTDTMVGASSGAVGRGGQLSSGAPGTPWEPGSTDAGPASGTIHPHCPPQLLHKKSQCGWGEGPGPWPQPRAEGLEPLLSASPRRRGFLGLAVNSET